MNICICITESLRHIPETIDIINQLYSNKILKQINTEKEKKFNKKSYSQGVWFSRSWMGEGICMLMYISMGLSHVWGSTGLGHDLLAIIVLVMGNGYVPGRRPLSQLQ